MTHTAYLGLGGNQGDRHANMQMAIEEIRKLGTVEAVSSFIVTEPWGYDSPNAYLNAALRLNTDLDPMSLLDATQDIELRMGRTVKTGSDGVYHDRPIDIDILLYDNLSLDTPRLKIPHPLMHQRDFVMQPLAEIAEPCVLAHALTGSRQPAPDRRQKSR